MAVTNTVRAIPILSLPTSSVVDTGYTLVGSLSQPCFYLRIQNTSDADVEVSYDGTNQNDYLVAGQTLTINSQTNAQPNNFITTFPIGFSVYVKGTAGMSGNIYVSGYYSPRSTV